jgi:hypothetical protein
MKRFLIALFVMASAMFFTQPASATLIIYEGFQYSNVNDPIDAVTTVDTDATGLAGTWSDAGDDDGNEMFLKSGSLTHSNLQTSGNHIGFSSNSDSDIMVRTLTSGTATDAQDSITALGASNNTLYFSFMFEKLQNNFGADHEGLALMNGALPEARWDSGNAGAIGRHGFAVAAVTGGNLNAVAYDGTTGARVVSTNTLSAPLNTPRFILGEISFNTGTGGADVFSLYSVSDDGDLDATDLTLIDTIQANVDESLLTTLNLTRQVNVNYDEIRFADTPADVLPIPEPSSLALFGLGGLVLYALRRRPPAH